MKLLSSTHETLLPIRQGNVRSISANVCRKNTLTRSPRRVCEILESGTKSIRQRNAIVVRSAISETADYVEDNSLRIEKISFGAILTPLGVGLLAYGFGAFFQLLPGTEVSALMLIYGFPISLLGFALSYAQLKPVPCKTTRQALALRDTQATNIQKQLREDVTRYRYGDEQHLDEALDRIFKFGRATGIPRRLTPKLVAVREEVREGAYTLILDFDTSKDMTLEMWTDRKDTIQTFFGPGIKAEIDPREGGVEVALLCDGSGAGRGEAQQQEVLPPLMPGLPARVKTADK
eukprot:jgi/Botrbrau1/20446/Bobra.145_2s0010.1